MPTPETMTTGPTGGSVADRLLAYQASMVGDHLRLTVTWTGVLAVLLMTVLLTDPRGYAPTPPDFYSVIPGRSWPLVGVIALALLLEISINLGIGLFLKFHHVRTRGQVEEVMTEPRESTRSLLLHARLPFWSEALPIETALNSVLWGAAVTTCGWELLSIPVGSNHVPYMFNVSSLLYPLGPFAFPATLAIPSILVGGAYWVKRRATLHAMNRDVLALGPGSTSGGSPPSDVEGDAGAPLDMKFVRDQTESLRTFATGVKGRCESNEVQTHLVFAAFAFGVLMVAAFAVDQSSFGFSPLFQAGWYDIALLALLGLLLAYLFVRSRLKGTSVPIGRVPPEDLSAPRGDPLLDLLQELTATRDLMLRSRRLSQGNLLLAILGTVWLELFLLIVFPFMAESGFELPLLGPYWGLVPVVALLLYLPFWGRGALAEESGRFKMASTALGVVELERRFWSRF